MDKEQKNLPQKLEQLYNGSIKGYASHTEADFAFCKLIAPLCHYDTEVMDKIYRSSGLMRSKWDRKQQGSTFGQIVLHKAISDG